MLKNVKKQLSMVGRKNSSTTTARRINKEEEEEKRHLPLRLLSKGEKISQIARKIVAREGLQERETDRH